MHQRVKARSPAKLILSGEHAVVYGKPALAMATQYYTDSTAETSPALLSSRQQIQFRFPDLPYAKALTLSALRQLKKRIVQDYQAFLAGERSIKTVLKKPAELLQFTLANVVELCQAVLPPMELQLCSTIPVGCGMGSSAAAIMSTLAAVAKLFQLELDNSTYLRLGMEAERLQHGYSSGLDVQLVWQGGGVYFKEGTAAPRPLTSVPLYGINTGKPASTTGEAVLSARKHFVGSSTLANDFEAVTDAVDAAFANNDQAAIQAGIQENHRLLYRIGVVPDPIARFIAAIEETGAAAKICGAGAVKGEAAGIVLVVPKAIEAALAVAAKWGFSIERIQGDLNGTQLL